MTDFFFRWRFPFWGVSWGYNWQISPRMQWSRAGMDFMPMASWDEKHLIHLKNGPLKSFQDPKRKESSSNHHPSGAMFNFGSVNSGSPFVDNFFEWFQDGIVLGQGFFQQRFQGTILINGLCLTSRVNDSTLGWVLYQNGWSLPSLMSDEISSKHWFSTVNSLRVLQLYTWKVLFHILLGP